MNKTERIALQTIYETINDGGMYGYDILDISRPYFHIVLCTMYSKGKKYIWWRHAGQSANKNTLKELEWVITTIFKMTPTEFIGKYITGNESKAPY